MKNVDLWCLDHLILHLFFVFAGVPCPCRDSKSWVGWHPDERQTPTCAVCHALCSFVCEESVSICFQRAPGRSFLTVWNGWEGRCHCRRSWALHGQGHCRVCLQTGCQKSSRSVQWRRLPSHRVSAVEVEKAHLCNLLKEFIHLSKMLEPLGYSFFVQISGPLGQLLLSLWSSLMMKMVSPRNWHRRTPDIKRKYITICCCGEM